MTPKGLRLWMEWLAEACLTGLIMLGVGSAMLALGTALLILARLALAAPVLAALWLLARVCG